MVRGKRGISIQNKSDDGFATGHPTEHNKAERRVVTVLYADIVDSTNIISTLDADDTVDFLDEIINKMVRAIHAFGGKVLGVHGDGIKAVFGATYSQEDHALRAALAGLKILQLMDEKTTASHVPKASVRIGMHSGFVIVRWQKNDFGGGLDTVGSTAHIAAKIEQHTHPNMVTASKATADLISEYADLRPCGDLNSSNDPGNEAVNLYEVLSIGAEFKNTYAAAMRDQHPLVGRQKELNTIKLYLDRALHDEHGPLCIVGEAGVGKSRLIYAAENAALQKNITTEIVGGIGVYKDVPYYVLRTLVKKIMQIIFQESSKGAYISLDTINSSSQQKIALNMLLSSDNEALSGWSIPTDDKQIAIYDGFSLLLKHVLKYMPLLVIMEDVHDIDYETMRCLDFAVQAVNIPSFSLLLTSRPKTEKTAEKMSSRKIILTPLSPPDSKKLVMEKIGRNVDPDKIKTILDRANGLPLALVEFCKSAHLSKPDSTPATLPLALEPLLRQRLDGLSPDGQKLVQYASALGNLVNTDQLKSILDLSTPLFKKTLAEVFHAKIMRHSKTGHIVFEHQLFQVACYNHLLRNDRRKIHSIIYGKFMKTNKMIVTSSPQIHTHQVLAYHAEMCEQYEFALEHLVQACSGAINQSAVMTARNLYYKAVGVCDKIGSSAQVQKTIFALKAFDAFHQLTREAELYEIFTEARQSHFDDFDAVNKALIISHSAFILWTSGQSGFLKLAQEGNNIAKKTGYFPLLCHTQFILSNMEHSHGHIESAVCRIENTLSKFIEHKLNERFGQMIIIPSVMLGTFASRFCVDLGDYDRGTQFLEKAQRTARQENHLYSNMLCNIAMGYRHLRMDMPSKAIPFLQRANTISMNNSYLSVSGVSIGCLCKALLNAGRIDEADKILKNSEKLEHLSRIQNLGAFYILSAKGQLFALKGEEKIAIDTMEKAIQKAAKNQDLVHQAYGHYELGTFCKNIIHMNEKVKFHLDIANNLARKCKMKTLVKKCEQALK